MPLPQPATVDDPRPVEPERPLPMECCDSGCDSCVHDVYADEVRHYRELLAAWQDRNPGRSAG
nr:oxidoreductase-like domain-containing protein [Lysobacter antarcticus]